MCKYINFCFKDQNEVFKYFDEDDNGTLDSKEIGKVNAYLFNVFPRFGYKGMEPPGRSPLCVQYCKVLHIRGGDIFALFAI